MWQPQVSQNESAQAARVLVLAYPALAAPAVVVLIVASMVRGDGSLALAACALLAGAVLSGVLSARLIRALNPADCPAPIAFAFWILGLALPVLLLCVAAAMLSSFWLHSSALRDALAMSRAAAPVLPYAVVVAALLLTVPMVPNPDKLVALRHRRGLVTERTAFAVLAVVLLVASIRWATRPARFASDRRGRLSEQLPLLQREAQRYPTHFRSQYRLGNALTTQRDCAAAIEPLRRAVGLRPTDGWAQNDLSYALLCGRQYSDAIAPGREAMRLLPNDRRPYYNLAWAYERTGDDADAADVYRRLLIHWPHEARAMAREAFIRYRGGARKEALAELRRAMAIDDTSFAMRFSAGELFSSAAMLGDALQQYRALATSDSGNVWSWGQYASTAYLNGNLAEARQAFDHLAAIAPAAFRGDSSWQAMRDAAEQGIPPGRLPPIPPWDPHSDRTTLLRLR